MQRVVRRLKRLGVRLNELDALEMFGGTGTFHTIDYAARVRSLDAWELDPTRAAEFRRTVPNAKITITDAYLAAKNASKRYGLIVADNPMSWHGDHVEHFDLLGEILRIAQPDAVVILNVIPEITPAALRRFPYLSNERQREARSAFYRTATPDSIGREQILDAYASRAAAAGRSIAWSFFVRRHFVFYLVLGLGTAAPASQERAADGIG
ncbi:MAG TPA: hypothetical protein VHI13_22680 [Candidatus Kapabacteria bacterium]|nr:hypothetical protein [Candidatus Kapabacteria bacterium]